MCVCVSITFKRMCEWRIQARSIIHDQGSDAVFQRPPGVVGVRSQHHHVTNDWPRQRVVGDRTQHFARAEPPQNPAQNGYNQKKHAQMGFTCSDWLSVSSCAAKRIRGRHSCEAAILHCFGFLGQDLGMPMTSFLLVASDSKSSTPEIRIWSAMAAAASSVCRTAT